MRKSNSDDGFFIEMYIAPFPDFEMYAHFDDGLPKALLRHSRTDPSQFSLSGGQPLE